MTRYLCAAVGLALLSVFSCAPKRPAVSSRDIPVSNADELFRSGYSAGYRAMMRRPAKGVLTIKRTGHDDTVLERRFAPGDSAAFGYVYDTFVTRAGVEERKLCVRLLWVRSGALDTQQHDFLLDSRINGSSDSMKDPMEFGETFRFATLKCGEDEPRETVELFIRFEESADRADQGHTQ